MAPLSSTHTPQVRIPATYMRGGTSKGVFFRLGDLPERCQQPGPARDALFMRVIGSPDPYSAHMDGMGGATSSTSKCVILSKSQQPDHDVDYLYGQVAIDKPFVDWSGNCGNLSTAAGAFAIHAGLVDPARIPHDGTCVVRIWQANIGKTIIAHVPVTNGQVQETGDFELDGVSFPAAEVVLEFLDPSDDGEEGGALFPTGNLIDDLAIRAPSCAKRSTQTPRHWRASSRSASPAPCAWGSSRRRRRRPPASTPPRSPSSRRPGSTAPPAASKCRRTRSTCWYGRSPWASCTTP